jgi:hypothetical protein
MNFAKRILMFEGCVVLAAVLISVLAPKATHALVATLVQISNTSASPVPNRDVHLPALAATQLQSCSVTSFSGVAGVGGGTCSPSFTVPAGQRFVLQQLEADCTAPRGNNMHGAHIDFVDGGSGNFHPFVLISEGETSEQVEYAQNQQVNY